MKLSTALVVIASTAAVAVKVDKQEEKDWNSCVNRLLDTFDEGDDGSKAACNMWNCMHNQASKYNRGGGITVASRLLNPVCWTIGMNPFRGHGAAKVTAEEEKKWFSCSNQLLDQFDAGNEGNSVACDYWYCLQTQASAFHRGGVITTLSNILDPICVVAREL